MNLLHVRLLVDSQFATGLPFEVLHCIGDVDFAAVDPGLFKALVQQLTRRPDKGMALFVLTISGLLANHHDGDGGSLRWGCSFQFSEDGPGCIAIKIATATFLSGLLQDGSCPIFRYKRTVCFAFARIDLLLHEDL
jgi:hypothetical protein